MAQTKNTCCGNNGFFMLHFPIISLDFLVAYQLLLPLALALTMKFPPEAATAFTTLAFKGHYFQSKKAF